MLRIRYPSAGYRIQIRHNQFLVFSLSGHIHDLFHTIEKYSPFYDSLESDEDYIARLKTEYEEALAKKQPPATGTPGIRSVRCSDQLPVWRSPLFLLEPVKINRLHGKFNLSENLNWVKMVIK